MLRRQLTVSEAACACARAASLDAAQDAAGPDDEKPDGRPDRDGRQYGRYGYRKSRPCCVTAGWLLNDKRVERIWRREGLKVPPDSQEGTLWLEMAPASVCVPTIAITCGRTTLSRTARTTVASSGLSTSSTSSPGNAWPSGFPASSTRRCHRRALRPVHSARLCRVTFVPTTALSSSPRLSRLDHSSWSQDGLYAPGSPWENGYIESFNARLRDELLDGEIFYSLKEAKIIIERWRRHYNTVRPHGSLSYKPPAPEGFVPAICPPWPAAQPENQLRGHAHGNAKTHLN